MTDLIKNIVFIDDNRAVTTSELVAKYFNKEHKNVLRDIKNLDCSDDFAKLNFELCYKINDLQNGKPNPYYKITKDGFMFLCMGYTGKQASQIKETYINAFNAMYEALINQGLNMQELFNQADCDYKLIDRHASHAGRALNFFGKIAKPQAKQKRDYYLGKLQLTFNFNSKGVSDD